MLYHRLCSALPGFASRRGVAPTALLLTSLVAVLLAPCPAAAQDASSNPAAPPPPAPLESTQEWNQRLQELMKTAAPAPFQATQDYRIGPDDLLDITVFEAPEMNREVRVSAGGEVTLALLGSVNAAGLSPHELELVLQELLRRTFIKDPHVSVFVKEMQSHTVSVFGAVKQPGVLQIRGSKTLLEILSMAQGLDDDAGDTVIVMHGAGTPPRSAPASADATAEAPAASSADTPAANPPADSAAPTAPASTNPAGTAPAPTASIAAADTVELTPTSAQTAAASPGGSLEINLKKLLESGDPQYNVPVYPGDIVKVTRAGIVYVVGEVNKPGGFVLKSNENISLLQALALGEGLTSTAAKSRTLIIRTEPDGSRTELPLDLGKVLGGKAPDPYLHPNDIVFVPNSAAKKALFTGLDAALRTLTGVIIWRR